ncbi:hypothetical protein ACSHT0_17245 [Tepidicaulis sp. LMO-SS28]|uniref:hypothetical protein n=1 Tax=Tepidicaulis sp. LMO-SS28 TaxID=3447455 RepID=UPI003EDEBD70
MLFRYLPVLFMSALFMTGPALAAGERWHFDPGKGLEGRAYVENVQGQRLEAECGNGGGPALTLSPSPGGARAPSGEGPLLLFQIDIDGTLYDQSFRCPAGVEACHTVTMPHTCLIDALKDGAQVRFFFAETFAAQFSLSGAKAALDGLSACTGLHRSP